MSEITKAIQFLCDEKNLPYESVMEAIELALAAAYRKDFGNKQQNIKVKFDPETGGMKAWDVKTVVENIEESVLEAAQEELAKRREKAKDENRELTEEETADLPRFNPKIELMKTVAKEIQKKAKVGDVLEIALEIPSEFGRMAAQTAKQVIIQKVREAERNLVFNDFKVQEGQLVMGTIQRVESRKILVDFGKVTGILPSDQQTGRDHYRPGARMKFYLASVQMSPRGPEIILSRNHPGMVKEIFKQEIPEIGDGLIEVKGIARDAGYRSKVAVFTSDEAIDPIGSCIGQRGARINTIIEELGGEKIDIIQYSEDAREYISHALSPAKIMEVKLDESVKTAEVSVVPDQFSLAIGRSGQNVRLAAELTGWKINVVEAGTNNVVSSDNAEEKAAEEKPTEDAAASEKSE
ncbi:MAG: transcription termination factor NusA [Patescibacteria group bacterium]